MNCKIFICFISVCLLHIFLLNGVYAVGISYSEGGMFDFQPGWEKTFDYEISTNAPSTMDYQVLVKGELKDYVTVSQDYFKDVMPRQRPAFTATLKLPDTMEPGLHEAYICALEMSTRGGGMVGARTEACTGFSVRVLYGEKYLRITHFNVPNAGVGERLKMELGVKSWSAVDINSIKASIDIFGPSKEKGELQKIGTVETDEKILKSNEAEILTAYLDTTGMEPGLYGAFATLYYDDKQINDSTGFRIGTLSVKIINYTKEFEQGKVNKLGIQILSQWNSPIDGIYATVDIGDEKLVTPTISLEPWSNLTLLTYWDTTNKNTGVYKGKIIVYYSNKTAEEQADFRVVIPKGSMLMPIIIACIIALLVLSLIFLIYKVRKQGKAETRKIKAQKR